MDKLFAPLIYYMGRVLGYNSHMVVDRMRNVGKYSALSEGIRGIGSLKPAKMPDFYGYRTDKDHTVVFSVLEGSVLFSTSWRENPDSRDANAAVVAKAGDFALFLPGEPFIMRSISDDAECDIYILE